MSKVNAKKLSTLSNTALRYMAQQVAKKAFRLTGNPLLLIPGFMEIRLTLRCNLKCRQCEEWKLKAEELSTEFWKGTIKNIYETIGPYCIRFYGGEPFCRADLLELLEYCNSLGIITSITTNGTFIDRKMAENLSRCDVSLVNVSLDGYDHKTHDDLRGIPGTYEKVIKAIDCLRKNNIPVHINTTIMQSNLNEIIGLVKLAEEKRAFITFQGYFPDNYSAAEIVHKQKDESGERSKDRSSSLEIQDKARAAQVLDELMRLKKTNRSIIDPLEYLKRLKAYIICPESLKKPGCEAVGSRLMLHNDGNINLCSYGGPIGPIGSLKEQTLKQVWASEKAKNKIRQMRECDCTECLVDRGSCKEGVSVKLRKLLNIFFSKEGRG